MIVLDGMQGGTATTQDVFVEQVGIHILPAVQLAVDALQELDMRRKVQLVVSGGIRTGADVAKALAVGVDACSIGTAALIAMGDNSPEFGAGAARRHQLDPRRRLQLGGGWPRLLAAAVAPASDQCICVRHTASGACSTLDRRGELTYIFRGVPVENLRSFEAFRNFGVRRQSDSDQAVRRVLLDTPLELPRDPFAIRGLIAE
jgi:hypothetical protein